MPPGFFLAGVIACLDEGFQYQWQRRLSIIDEQSRIVIGTRSGSLGVLTRIDRKGVAALVRVDIELVGGL